MLNCSFRIDRDEIVHSDRLCRSSAAWIEPEANDVLASRLHARLSSLAIPGRTAEGCRRGGLQTSRARPCQRRSGLAQGRCAPHDGCRLDRPYASRAAMPACLVPGRAERGRSRERHRPPGSPRGSKPMGPLSVSSRSQCAGGESAPDLGRLGLRKARRVGSETVRVPGSRPGMTQESRAISPHLMWHHAAAGDLARSALLTRPAANRRAKPAGGRRHDGAARDLTPLRGGPARGRTAPCRTGSGDGPGYSTCSPGYTPHRLLCCS